MQKPAIPFSSRKNERDVLIRLRIGTSQALSIPPFKVPLPFIYALQWEYKAEAVYVFSMYIQHIYSANYVYLPQTSDNTLVTSVLIW